ncbi:hypothetical protein EON83_13800 [bacterium]|nr:MAG: hypothetical protein EON83_13800 [bacterium]
MKKFLFSLCCLGISNSVWACGSGPTSVTWKDWSVKSNEMRWLGVSHNGMPLHHIVDGDPKTAWVWSGLGGPVAKFRRAPKNLLFVRETPFEVDEVRILSGYNKSAALWKRNNRIESLRITRNGDVGSTWRQAATSVKTVSLSDSRGWHHVSLPRQKVTSIGMDILSEYRGRDNDLCVSEVEFYNKGRKVNFQLPRVVASLDGFEDIANLEDYEASKKQPQRKPNFPDGLIDRISGRVLNSLQSEQPFTFSPDGKFVLALNDELETHTTAQVFDVMSARQKWQRKFRYAPNYPEISWQNGRRLKVVWSPRKEESLPVRFVQF